MYCWQNLCQKTGIKQNISDILIRFSVEYSRSRIAIYVWIQTFRGSQHFNRYYLIYLTLHWPFLINLRQCSLSINCYEYSCHTIWASLFNTLFIRLIYGKVAQWLKFCAVNHGIMHSNPAETVYTLYFFIIFSRIFYLIIFFVDFFAYFTCSLFIYNHNNARTT